MQRESSRSPWEAFCLAAGGGLGVRERKEWRLLPVASWDSSAQACSCPSRWQLCTVDIFRGTMSRSFDGIVTFPRWYYAIIEAQKDRFHCISASSSTHQLFSLSMILMGATAVRLVVLTSRMFRLVRTHIILGSKLQVCANAYLF